MRNHGSRIHLQTCAVVCTSEGCYPHMRLSGFDSAHQPYLEVPESMSTRRIKIFHERLLIAIRLLSDEWSKIIYNSFEASNVYPALFNSLATSISHPGFIGVYTTPPKSPGISTSSCTSAHTYLRPSFAHR